MAAKTAVLFTLTEGPFEEKNGKALVEVYSPAPGFGLRTKTVFKEWIHFKGKRKSSCLQLSFSSLLFILAGTM